MEITSDRSPQSRLTPSEVIDDLDRGKRITFIDARSQQAWDNSTTKIPGAIRVPPGELDRHVAEVPPEHELITYCDLPQEQSSAALAHELYEHGFTDVHPLVGGISAWHETGLPLEPK